MPASTPESRPQSTAESGPDPAPTEVPPGDEPTGRKRLADALQPRWSRGQAVAGVLLAVLGFAAVVQVQSNGQDQSFVGARQTDLIALINTLALATDRAEAEIAELRRTRDSLEDDAESTRTALEVARREADTLGILAGTLPAVGQGIRITVEAPEGAVGTDQLLNGLQELRNAGAEAIELNDSVRVIAQTGIRDAPGAGLVVDGVTVQTPYVIDAIGDPHTLATALEFDGGFIVEVEQVGGTVQVEEQEDVEVATTRQLPDTRFANPVEQE